MKMLKIILSLFLALSVLLSCFITVSATSNSNQISPSDELLICEALSDIEHQRDIWGLGSILFQEISIGKPVQTYNYENGGFVADNIMYPLTARDQLVLWVIPVNGQFQITNGLIPEINSIIDMDTPFALIYDSNNAYIYFNNTISILKQFNQKNESRDVINTNIRYLTHDINTVSLATSAPLGYKGNSRIANRGTPSNISCNVSYVTQHPYENLCWAASVACIVNYVNGTSYDAATVAKRFYGENEYDKSIGWTDWRSKLHSYGLTCYEFASYGSFDSKILNSLLIDRPVGGSFKVINGDYHATVIFGCNPISGRIQVMDPEFGSTTAVLSSSNQYTYVSNYTNAQLVLHGIAYEEL